ncbi:MAG: flagellar hook assembly protein FlgD [Ferrimonas sp.]
MNVMQSPIGASSNSAIDGLKWQKEQLNAQSDANKTLSQEDFFSLLSQQLAMQDPFKPVDNDQMIAQMSSFATVDGISNLNGGIERLNSVMTSNQALEASGLVGQKVLLPSNAGFLNNDDTGMAGVVNVGHGAVNPRAQIVDAAGQVVKTLQLPDGASGMVDFHWDGRNNDGIPMPAGRYEIHSNALVGGKAESLPSHAYAHVSSVTLGGAGKQTELNLKGLGGIALGDVLAVAQG